MILTGRVWSYGDNIDTDFIYPARYLNISEPTEMAKHCMEDLDPDFSQNVETGDIVVAGRNFGCGSSREHAPAAMKAGGITCVVANSFARIFYRNAINIGLPLLELGATTIHLTRGQQVRIDLSAGTVEDVASGLIIKAEPLPEFIQKIVTAGGLISYVKGEKK